jgi:hypothetical protein
VARRPPLAGGAAAPAGGAPLAQQPLGGELGLAVRIGRRQDGVFVDGDALGRTVDGRRRREDDARHAGAQRRLEHRFGAADVHVVVALGKGDRLGDLGERRHVDDSLAAAGGERGREAGGVADVGRHERGAGRDGRRVAARQVVVDSHRVAGGQQAGGDHAAYVAGAAGDENVHGVIVAGRRRRSAAAAAAAARFTSPRPVRRARGGGAGR